jgi:uncharacterized protein
MHGEGVGSGAGWRKLERMSIAIRDNPAANRYELDVEGKIVFALYRRVDGVVQIRHVESPPVLRGKGAAGTLMQGIAEKLREEGAKLAPLCSYARAWMHRHPEFQDLLA